MPSTSGDAGRRSLRRHVRPKLRRLAPNVGTAVALAMVVAMIPDPEIAAHTQDPPPAPRDTSAPLGAPASSGVRDALSRGEAQLSMFQAPGLAVPGVAWPDRPVSAPLGAEVPRVIVPSRPLPAGGGAQGFRDSVDVPRPTPRPTATPKPKPVATPKPRLAAPKVKVKTTKRVAPARPKPAPKAPTRPAARAVTGWNVAPTVTWYGPGFYGERTACGQRYSRTIIGVAHKTLPCGTLVQFNWGGRTASARVIDRGPFAGPGYVFDFSAALACDVFGGCFTRHNVRWRVVR